MTQIDVSLVQQLVNGGAVVMLVSLVVYVLRQSAERESTMRESFSKREAQFVDALKENSDKFASALKENTSALQNLSTKMSDNLDEMRRKIDV